MVWTVTSRQEEGNGWSSPQPDFQSRESGAIGGGGDRKKTGRRRRNILLHLQGGRVKCGFSGAIRREIFSASLRFFYWRSSIGMAEGKQRREEIQDQNMAAVYVRLKMLQRFFLFLSCF